MIKTFMDCPDRQKEENDEHWHVCKNKNGTYLACEMNCDFRIHGCPRGYVQ
jgi:hypothetical protein